MNFSKLIQKYYLDAIGIVMILTLYSFYYYDYYLPIDKRIKFVEEYLEDPAFDLLNYTFSGQDTCIKNIPDVVIIGVDDKFLQKEELINKNNEKTKKYGCMFSKKYLIELIGELDKLPNIKSLFIDYDLYACTHTKYEKKLIKILNMSKRKYPIFFAHNGSYNCLEDYNISKNIFVSENSLVDFDLITRKYSNYNAMFYPNVAFILTEHKPPSPPTKNYYDDYNWVANKILYKSLKRDKNQSYWNNLYKYSADDNISKILNQHKNTIILFGETYSRSEDKKNIYNLINDIEEIHGVENVANIIMTQFYLDGQLKIVPFWIATIIFIVVYFAIRVFVYYLLDFLSKKHQFKNDGILSISITISITFVIYFLISWIILVYYKMWFNYRIPLFIAFILKAKDIKNILSRSIQFIKKELKW